MSAQSQVGSRARCDGSAGVRMANMVMQLWSQESHDGEIGVDMEKGGNGSPKVYP